MKKKLLIFTILAFLIVAFKTTELSVFYTPPRWPQPSYNFSNNLPTPEKLKLGRALFHDPILSRDHTISCSSCHLQYTAFSHVDHALSHGIDDRSGLRNSPVLVNLAWQKTFMWDGAVNHLDVQALAPISNADEMDETPAHVVQKLRTSSVYKRLFLNAYGDTLITGERMLKALSHFMLSFVSANSLYDSVMRHQSSFNKQEQSGYVLFKKNCSSCHQEPLFTNHSFERNGLAPDPVLKDYGRMRVTGDKKDSLKFKVPTLRNIEFSYPYMHDGRFKTLHEVIDHYSHNQSSDDKRLQRIHLSATDKVDLFSFLLTLTDKHFLFNPDFSYPKEILMPATINPSKQTP